MFKTEKELQDAIIEYLERNGFYVYRAMGNAMAAKGTPDILCCIHGVFVGIELKLEHHGKYGLTKPQEVRLRQIQKAGGLGFCVTSIEEVEEIVGIAHERCSHSDCSGHSGHSCCSVCYRPLSEGGTCDECRRRSKT